jgi:CubicO group peptidase (beta-lactamase class C family)
LVAAGDRAGAVLDYMRQRPRVSEPGTAFSYSTGDIFLLGEALAAATGKPLPTLLSDIIWRPFGMEADGDWLLEAKDGHAFGGCCISATLRDYARVGMFVLEGGRAQGKAVLPDDWIAQSTTAFKPGGDFGFLWWTTASGAFEAKGIFGQSIYVNRKDRVVIAVQSAQNAAVDGHSNDLRSAFEEAAVRNLD